MGASRHDAFPHCHQLRIIAVMTKTVQSLHKSVTTILRALKIAETEIRVAHQAYNFVAADIQTLRFLAEHNGCKLSELAEHLGVAPTTASSIIDRLVGRKLVSRERQEDNRRAISLSLTTSGAKAFSLLEAEEMATMKIMLDALAASDRDTFVAQMARIADTVSEKRNL